MKEDVKMWLSFLEKFNGCSYYDRSDWIDLDSLHLYTDSAGNSKMGCAAIFETHWAYCPWPYEWKGREIMRDITFFRISSDCLGLSYLGKTTKKEACITVH